MLVNSKTNELQLFRVHEQENCKVRSIAAGTLRVPLLPRQYATISPRQLPHTECA